MPVGGAHTKIAVNPAGPLSQAALSSVNSYLVSSGFLALPVAVGGFSRGEGEAFSRVVHRAPQFKHCRRRRTRSPCRVVLRTSEGRPQSLQRTAGHQLQHGYESAFDVCLSDTASAAIGLKDFFSGSKRRAGAVAMPPTRGVAYSRAQRQFHLAGEVKREMLRLFKSRKVFRNMPSVARHISPSYQASSVILQRY